MEGSVCTIPLPQGAPQSVEWRRLNDVYPTSSDMVFPPKIVSPSDLSQGTHKDCFLVACISVLSRHQSAIADLCHKADESSFVVQFWRQGRAVRVRVDDQVPCTRSGPYMLRSPTGAWWPLLLEKAYAAFYGSYDAVSGGNISECLYDLTGRPVTDITFANDKTIASAKSKGLWKELRRLLADGGTHVAVAGTKSTVQPADTGLQSGHAYGLVGVVEHGSMWIVELQNPFRGVEMAYKGRAGPTDKRFWTADARAALHYDPDDKRAYDRFFMLASDFFTHFTGIHICDLSVSPAASVSCDGAWDEVTAGGSPNYRSWGSNPMYRLELAKESSAPTQLHIGLSLPEQRCGKRNATTLSYHQIGLGVVAQNTPGSPFIAPNAFSWVAKSDTFWNKREVFLTCQVPPNTASLVVIPCTHSAGVFSPFRMTVFGGSCSLTPLEKGVPVSEKEGIVHQGDNVAFTVSVEPRAGPIHFLLEHSEAAAKRTASKPAKPPSMVTTSYLGLDVAVPGDIVGGVTPINYFQISHTVAVLEADSITVTVRCAKASRPVKFCLRVHGSCFRGISPAETPSPEPRPPVALVGKKHKAPLQTPSKAAQTTPSKPRAKPAPSKPKSLPPVQMKASVQKVGGLASMYAGLE